MQPNILNLIERVLFLLTSNEKVNKMINLHIQLNLGVNLHLFSKYLE